ncbi:FixH family protein [Myxococcus sp. RHSTA-1-4]|uniref:FixH family protein n=1 Tax=Myxococcus sp. RHSTA-1-4 TaxID=2874601 RepID=UPI001CBAE242|nr:FixH family protein [Myxococcus sp. RHSTA-1-4]MBZ4421962.1 FixH family protein [Myxococcus sp. RHSTA-1-4]
MMRRLTGMLFLLTAVAGFGCGEDTPTPQPLALTKLSEVASGPVALELWSPSSLSVGLNRVFYKVSQGGQPVTEATLTQHPVMKMMGHQHGCPSVDPDTEASADGLFEGALVFTMPSGDAETWDLTVDVTPAGATEKTSLTLVNLPVADKDSRRTLSVDSGAGARKLHFTLNFPKPPTTGANEFVLTAHTTGPDMMTFPPVTDLSITATPEMPSMGHGSSGNVDPIHQGQGFYKGQVNFSMAGDWVLRFRVARGEETLGTFEYAFDI